MAEAVNHLNGRSGNLVEVLRDLTDRELDELATYLSQERDARRSEAPDGRTHGNRYSAYRLATTIDFVSRERDRRRRATHPSPA